MKTFETHFGRQASNIRNCIELSPGQKDDFFLAIKAVADDKDKLRDAAVSYFREPGRKLCGRVVPMDPAVDKVGRLHQWEKIEDLLEKASHSGNFMPASSPIIKDLRERFCNGDANTKRNVLEEVFEYLQAAKAACPPLVWAFLFQERQKLFIEENLKFLPCRLGLENIDHKDYLPFEIEAPSTLEAKKPTAFDAELDEYWIPGGKTRPRDECSDKDGLDEVVFAGFNEHTSPEGLMLWSMAKVPTFRKLSVVK